MNKTKKERRRWSSPELRRIDAGSAQNATNTGVKDDGGLPSQDKS